MRIQVDVTSSVFYFLGIITVPRTVFCLRVLPLHSSSDDPKDLLPSSPVPEITQLKIKNF